MKKQLTISYKINNSRIIKHQPTAFTNENVSDKLRVQIYQAASHITSTTNQFVQLNRCDIALRSIASREKYMMNMMSNAKQPSMTHESMIESSIYEEANRYSAFTHGNSLNEYYANQGTMSMSAAAASAKKVSSSGAKLHAIPMQQSNADNVNYLVILVGAICLAILFLPVYGSTSTESMMPKYMHVNHEIKLFASFVLGKLKERE